jgi:hypothetical protein
MWLPWPLRFCLGKSAETAEQGSPNSKQNVNQKPMQPPTPAGQTPQIAEPKQESPVPSPPLRLPDKVVPQVDGDTHHLLSLDV